MTSACFVIFYDYRWCKELIRIVFHKLISGYFVVVEKPHVLGLFKNVQMQGAQKIEP
jgi:hypothetical protein